MNDPDKVRKQLLRGVAKTRQPGKTTDQTDKRQPREILAGWESELRYGLLVETMNEALIVFNADWEVVFVNDRLCEVRGCSREEILGRSAEVLFSQADRGLFREEWKKRSRGQAGSYEARVLHKDGTSIPALISSRPICDADGRFAGAVALVTDLRELRKADEMLRMQCELASALNTTNDLKTALTLLLQAALQIGGIDAGGVYLIDRRDRQMHLVVHRGLSPQFAAAVEHYDIDATENRLAMTGKSLLLRPDTVEGDLRTLMVAEGLHCALVLPVLAKGRTIAVMNVASRTRDEIPPRDRQVLETITGRMSGVIVRIRTEEALRESQKSLQKEQKLLRQLLEMQERDRKLVAYEIHDGLAQLLAGASFRLQRVEELQATKPEEARRTLEEGLRLLDRSVKEARNLICGLRPPVLDEEGVVPAIEYLIYESQRSGGPVIEFHHQIGSERLPGPLEIAVFRIVQESLTNAQRYSQSERVTLDLVENSQWLKIEVRDWGVGFQPDQVEGGHFGLEGMRERARLLGGRATIDSSPGKGAHIVVEIPLSSAVVPLPLNGVAPCNGTTVGGK